MNTIAWISKWLERRQKATWKRGHSFAAGELLRGARTLDDLETLADNPWERRTAFEDGMSQACSDWRKLAGRTS